MDEIIAQNRFTKIASALQELLARRIDHFVCTDSLYRRLQNTDVKLGLEAMVKAELYGLLRHYDGSVFLEFPMGGGRRKIDLAYLSYGILALIELKMYHSQFQEYRNDFTRLKELVDKDHSTLGILLHFHLYQQAPSPVDLFSELHGSLDDMEYWRSYTPIVDPSEKHFLTLGFAKLGHN